MSASGGGGGSASIFGITDTPAYIILGHGSEDTEEGDIEVPPGNMVIVKAKCGEVTYATNKIFAENNNYSKYRTPLLPKSKYDLFRKYNSLAYYMPGDLCPNFQYRLLENIQHHETLGDIFYLAYSGICKIPDVRPELPDFSTRFVNADQSIDSFDFPECYKYSIYPTQRQVKSEVGFIKSELGKSEITIREFCEYELRHPGSSIFRVSQYDIFYRQMGYAASGIFYNLICRSTPIISNNLLFGLIPNNIVRSGRIQPNYRYNLFKTNNNANRLRRLRNLNMRASRKSSEKNNVSSNPSAVGAVVSTNNRPDTRSILLRHIGETVQRRRAMPEMLGVRLPPPVVDAPSMCTGLFCRSKKGGTRKYRKYRF